MHWLSFIWRWFNCLTRQVGGYGNSTLPHIFYSGLPDWIKNEISCIGKPLSSMAIAPEPKPSMPGTRSASLKFCARPRTLCPSHQAPAVRDPPALPTPRASPRRRIIRAPPAPLALQSWSVLKPLPISGKMASWMKKSTSSTSKRSFAWSVANLVTWQRIASSPPWKVPRLWPEQLRLRLLPWSQKIDSDSHWSAT